MLRVEKEQFLRPELLHKRKQGRIKDDGCTIGKHTNRTQSFSTYTTIAATSFINHPVIIRESKSKTYQGNLVRHPERQPYLKHEPKAHPAKLKERPRAITTHNHLKRMSLLGLH